MTETKKVYPSHRKVPARPTAVFHKWRWDHPCQKKGHHGDLCQPAREAAHHSPKGLQNSMRLFSLRGRQLSLVSQHRAAPTNKRRCAG